MWCITWLAVPVPVLSLLMGWSWLIRATRIRFWMEIFMKSLSDRSCCVLLGFADCVAALQPQVWLSSYPTCRGNGNMRTCGGAAHFCKLLVSFECSVFDCKLWARRGGNVCASHFCFVLVVGLMTVDACQASFSTKHGDKTNKSTGKSREQDFVVSGNTALFQFW